MTISGTPGTGNATLGSALSSPDQSFLAAYGAVSTTVDVEWYSDATTTTRLGVERNVTYNGGSPGTLTRGTPETPGSLVSLGAGASVRVVLPASSINVYESIAGVFGNETVSITGATTLTATAFGKLHVCSGTAADYTVGLPAVSGNSGKLIGFSMAAGLTRFVTLDGNSSETIDGATTRVMWAQETALLYCDGSTWTKLSGKSRSMYCHMAPSANATLVSGTELKSTLNTTIADNSTRMADTTNGRMTVRRASIYNLAVSSRVSGASSNIVRFLGIGRKNGSASDYTVQAEISVLSGGFAFAYLSIPLNLAGSDYFELWGLQDSGTNKTWAGDGSTQQSNMSLIEVPQW
jgi:hypothetical protein